MIINVCIIYTSICFYLPLISSNFCARNGPKGDERGHAGLAHPSLEPRPPLLSALYSPAPVMYTLIQYDPRVLDALPGRCEWFVQCMWQAWPGLQFCIYYIYIKFSVLPTYIPSCFCVVGFALWGLEEGRGGGCLLSPTKRSLRYRTPTGSGLSTSDGNRTELDIVQSMQVKLANLPPPSTTYVGLFSRWGA